MSKENIEVNVNGGGCLFIIGLVIVAICIGTLYEAVYGWLAFGALCVFWAMLAHRQ